MFFEEEKDFILSSHKNALKWGSNYTICSSREKKTEEDPEYLGNITSNFTGSFWNYFESKGGVDELIATITYNFRASACSSSPR